MHKSHTWEKSSSRDMGQNSLIQSNCRIFKSSVSLEENDGKAWFFACWYKFMEIKSWSKNGLFGVGTLKSAVSQEWIDEMNWFFACWYKFRKVNSYFANYWVGTVKNGWGRIDHRTLKSGVSHKWFDELSRLVEWFLHVDIDGIIFGLTTNLLCIFDM